ncbi:MAG: hypothetical protein IPJ88_11565 [Myxococcales bacterium]|nr:MAG: hypothetical protein IPJ88_11565 [Myxococcales bacterium]
MKLSLFAWLLTVSACSGVVDSANERVSLDTDSCQNQDDGLYCLAQHLMGCQQGKVVSHDHCARGCVLSEGMPQCVPEPVVMNPVQCPELPTMQGGVPEVSECNHMDWKRSDDGFYMVSRFGSDHDSSTYGHVTTCGYLQRHYDYHECVYDNVTGDCIQVEYTIPWVQGHVDYSRDDMLAAVEQNLDDDVPFPEYFYIAGAQRFGCGTRLRLSDLSTGRCVVVYSEDGGPGAAYEMPDKGARRIVDASPAVVAYLKLEHWGWANSTLLYAEEALPEDVPGQRCTPCQSTAMTEQNTAAPSVFRVNHMMPTSKQCEL